MVTFVRHLEAGDDFRIDTCVYAVRAVPTATGVRSGQAVNTALSFPRGSAYDRSSIFSQSPLLMEPIIANAKNSICYFALSTLVLASMAPISLNGSWFRRCYIREATLSPNAGIYGCGSKTVVTGRSVLVGLFCLLVGRLAAAWMSEPRGKTPRRSAWICVCQDVCFCAGILFY